jgi:hypothetical protein
MPVKKIMKYKQRTIDFLKYIAKKCDEEATDIITEANNSMTDDVDALVWSTMIMNIHHHAMLLIEKSNEQ